MKHPHEALFDALEFLVEPKDWPRPLRRVYVATLPLAWFALTALLVLGLLGLLAFWVAARCVRLGRGVREWLADMWCRE